MDKLEKNLRIFFSTRGKMIGVNPPDLIPHIKRVVEEANKGNKPDPYVGSAYILLDQTRGIIEERMSEYAVQLMEIFIQQFRRGINLELLRISSIIATDYKPGVGLSEEGKQKINNPPKKEK